MANDLRNMFFGFLLFGLFSVLIVTAIYGMGANYGVSNERMQEATGGVLNITDTENELIGSDAENYRQRFESGDVDNIDDASGIFSILGDFVSLITTPFKLLANVGQEQLKIPPVFTYTILTILNLAIIFGAWRVLRAGD